MALEPHEEEYQSEEPESDSEIEESDLSREPGGDSPEQIRARKEYRRAKRATQRADDLEKSLLQAQAELKATKEAMSQKPESPNAAPKYTEEEIREMMSDGRVDAPTGRAYIEELRARKEKQAEDKIINRVREEFKREQSVQTAAQQLEAYQKAIPALADQTSDEFETVKNEYLELIQLGQPENEMTQLLAVKAAFGSLDRLKKKGREEVAEFDRNHRETPMETHGGSRPSDGMPKAKKALKGIPDYMIQHWKESGYSEDEMVELAKYYTPRMSRQPSAQ